MCCLKASTSGESGRGAASAETVTNNIEQNAARVAVAMPPILRAKSPCLGTQCLCSMACAHTAHSVNPIISSPKCTDPSWDNKPTA